jgi:type IV pilus assembly protein PilX
MNHSKQAGAVRQAWQQGVILPITLIVLVAMTLAGIALLRSVDTSAVIAGNLAFKQSATASGDAGVEAAIAWLIQTAPSGSLDQDVPGSGYYATRQDALDLTGNKRDPEGAGTAEDDLNWDGAGVVKLGGDAAGNEVAYVIHRMCDSAGPLDARTCSTQQTFRKGQDEGAQGAMEGYRPQKFDSAATRAFYRITARVSGPRNTTSYVQAVVSI